MSRFSVLLRLAACVLSAALIGGCAGFVPPTPPAQSSSPSVPVVARVELTVVPVTAMEGAVPRTTTSADPPGETPTSTPAPSGAEIQLPYRAWDVSPGGHLCLLDASNRLHRFSPDLTQVLDSSSPLFDGADSGSAYLEIGEQFLVLSSESLTRTLVLDKESLAPVWRLDKGGPVALDGSRRLFVIAEGAVWAYNLANASASPVPVTRWPVDPFTPRPRNFAVDPEGGQLLVTLHDVSASPPHQQEWYAAYDLETLQPVRTFPGQLGELTRPSVGGGRIVAGMAAKNGFLGSKIALFDSEGNEVASAKPVDGKPVIDGSGEYIYILRERGIWVLRATDLSLVAMDPSMGIGAVDLRITPDGRWLYTIYDAAVRARQTAALREAGAAPLRGALSPAWFDHAQTPFSRARFYPAPGVPDAGYVQAGGYGETWRSQDRGATWELLPGLVYPSFHYATHLSISPDFSRDQTLVAVNFSSPMYLRSTDRGDTWFAWEPPVAFVSNRDGNREIYTADRGAPGGGPAQNLVRRTSHPAADENPAWSPGWTHIAFQSNRNGNWDIFTIRADCDPNSADVPTACDLRQITDHPADDMLPAWSPDGQWIAFTSTRGPQAELYLASASGGPAMTLTTTSNGAWRPAWLPDAQHVLFTAATPQGPNNILLGRIAEASDGGRWVREYQAVANTAADEREAAVGREFFVYLSNEGGLSRTYGRYTYDQATSFPFTLGTEAEAHPAVLDDGLNTLLLSLERDGQTGIYRANSGGYEPFVVGESFNGQPAAGPVPWQPGAEWSEERLRSWH